MKRTIKIIFVLLLIYFIFPIMCNAATNIDTANQRPVVGTSIEVRLRVDYGANALISEAHYYVKYDTSKLEFESLRWTQSTGTYSVNNGVITIDKESNTEAWEYGEPVVMVFKTIASDTSKISVEEKAPAKYKDGNVVAQYYSGITINAVPPSTATRIGKLSVEGYKLSPTFNAEKTEYTVTVPSDVSKVNITATKGEKNQTITGTGTRVLSFGPNIVRVIVTAQNGDARTYVITVNREDDRSNDVTLKSLSVSNTDITYKKGQTEYEAIVSKSIDNVFIAAQTTEPRAQLVGTGSRSLSIGENIFEIKVTSKDGANQTYKIKIIRSEEELKPNEASTFLETLTINSIKINLKDDIYNYVTSVGEDIKTLDINLTTKSTTAKYKIKGADKLKKGFNTITITVEDEELPLTEYFITVYKEPSIAKKYTSLEEILAEEKLEEHVYFVTSDSSIKITKEVLKKINENKKDFYYNFINEENTILYQLIIPTGTYTDEIDPSFVMEIDNPLTYTGKLPSGVSVMLYAGNLYGDETELQVYTYDELGAYTELTTALKVVNGYLNFTTNGEKSYVFSNQNLMGNSGFDLMSNLPMIIFGGLIIFLIAYIVIKKKKGKKEVKSNEPLY